MVSIGELAVRGLELVARRFRPAASPAHLQTGFDGERQALFDLRRRGYTVVARRWGSAKVRGDLDLIAWHGSTLCFVEVKTRTARDAVAAETAVDLGKRVQMRRLAAVYLNGFAEPERSAIDTRFDVISVYLLEGGPSVDLMEGAFGWRERGANAF